MRVPVADEGSVRLVLTLATPQKVYISQLHQSITKFHASLAAAPMLRVPLVSVAGGSADVQVASLAALWFSKSRRWLSALLLDFKLITCCVPTMLSA